jgi:hypothetical protein
MTVSRRAAVSFAAVTLLAPALAAPRDNNPIARLDKDNDGTLDHIEVRRAAKALFAALDPDHDGTLDIRELHGRLTAEELVIADPDHDGTLTVNEYLAIVGRRFKSADLDRDGTLNARELRSPPGIALLQLLLR